MKIKLICQQCGEEYFKYPSQAVNSKFCSKKCQGKHQAKVNNLGKDNRPTNVWNKGLTALEDERIMNLHKKGAETYKKNIKNGYIPKHRGVKLSQERKNNISKNHADMSGKNNPMYGRKGKLAPNYGGHVRGDSKKREDLSHRIRSRWEANFARILIYEQKEYKYEPTTFELSEEMTYTPDFWVEDEQCWYEIKGCWTEYSLKKFNKFKEEYPNENIKVCEKDMYLELYKEYKSKISWEFDKRGRI